jgi:hypothetical protein
MLTACNEKLDQYQEIIDRIDRIDIHYKDINKDTSLSSQQMSTFKKMLVRNIKPNLQTKFNSDIIVHLYLEDKRIAFLQVHISERNPFVNFNSDELNFGFPLTYGLGMFLVELKNKNSN